MMIIMIMTMTIIIIKCSSRWELNQVLGQAQGRHSLIGTDLQEA